MDPETHGGNFMVFNLKELSSSTAKAWFIQEGLGTVIVIQGRPFSPFVEDLRTWTRSMNITTLHLQLDRNHAHPSDNHLHHLYSDKGDREVKFFPNAAVEQDVVRLCHALSRTLAHLSISMCKPELMVGSYLPRIVYDILLKCPELQSLSLEDVQCAEFGEEYRPTATEMLYMEAIAMRDQQEMWSFSIQPKLQKLVISKRSAACWVENFACLNRVPAQNTATIYPPPRVVVNGSSESPELIASKRGEAWKLATLMKEIIPSLRQAYVMLDKGAVDLRMSDKDD